MLKPVRLLTRKLTSDTADANFGSVVSFVSAVLLWLVVVPKLLRLGLTEAQLIFGLLLLFVASGLCVALGLLLPVYQALRSMAKDRAD